MVASLLWLIGAYIAGVSAYMLCVVYGSWRYRSPRGSLSEMPATVFVVPAHNEEPNIGGTVRALYAARYPAERFAVLVIADNCADGTAAVARAAGARVLERDDPENRGKGQALQWCLDESADFLSGFDLVAFVDADMDTDPDFLAAVAPVFADPSVSVVQGRYTMSADGMSWLRAAAFASFAYVNHVRPGGRCYWGGTAGLKGGGMVFRRELIMHTGWPAHSIIEDVEFGLELLEKGVRVTYVPEARVTSTVSTRARDAAVQQLRWEGGKRAVYRRMVPRLMRRLRERPEGAVTDALLDALVPPLSVVLLVAVAGLIASLRWAPGAAALFAAAVPVFTGAVLSGLLQLRASRAVWAGLALSPAFVVWKLLLLAVLMVRQRPAQWQRTPRVGE